MSKSHNKKRNVGIIYELLLRNISDSLIKNDKYAAQKSLKIIEKRFDKSSELYKEFRLFNALVKSTVSNSAVGAAILTEAKQAARRCDGKRLNKEKSLLIRDINHSLKDSNFYYRRIPEYKIYATIQTLLNEWRAGDTSDLTRVIQYESRAVEWLLQEKTESPTLEGSVNSDVDALVVKIMTEKINKRYGDQLSEEQKEVVRDYVFSISNEKDNRIFNRLTETRDRILSDLLIFEDKTENSMILNKIVDVRKRILDESFHSIDDNMVSRFLVLIQLKKELSKAIKE